MFRRQIVTGEFRNQVKNLVGKSADVQNVGSFFGFRVRVRLDVNADEFRVFVSRFELVPLFYRFRLAEHLFCEKFYWIENLLKNVESLLAVKSLIHFLKQAQRFQHLSLLLR